MGGRQEMTTFLVSFLLLADKRAALSLVEAAHATFKTAGGSCSWESNRTNWTEAWPLSGIGRVVLQAHMDTRSGQKKQQNISCHFVDHQKRRTLLHASRQGTCMHIPYACTPKGLAVKGEDLARCSRPRALLEQCGLKVVFPFKIVRAWSSLSPPLYDENTKASSLLLLILWLSERRRRHVRKERQVNGQREKKHLPRERTAPLHCNYVCLHHAPSKAPPVGRVSPTQNTTKTATSQRLKQPAARTSFEELRPHLLGEHGSRE
ncbi:hypothetical protein CISG_05417 [Coccidioides immitis RMSCC 3703]|uniref:Secreted protein n=2 Tax=Coccidioides immitis TaxID=5501 RepID=A0A0J8TQB5_COCIT|nr:hypothetical protein CIRG_00689 [Coccidioides immitis RMSCC 2394]KMU75932.1 hypothetical protein CISG_05417 [Coccidioides immitis RMSCC 3703]